MSSPPGPGSTRPLVRRDVAQAVAVLLGLFAFYLALYHRYRPYDIDDTWFLSFSYNTFVEHVTTDQFMSVPFPSGMDGTQLFGRLAALVQYLVLNPLHWEPWAASTLSSVAVACSLGLWWLQLRRLGYSQKFALCFLVAAGVSEPFLAAANRTRYEWFSLLLISAGLLLASYGQIMAGTFVTALAVETEPAALLGVLVLLAMVGTCRPAGMRLASAAVRVATGALAAGLVYLALHPAILHLGTYLREASGVKAGLQGSLFMMYFVDRPRHLPELICLAVAAVLYLLRWRDQHTHYPGLAVLLVMMDALVMPHGNPAYMVLAYSPMAVFVLEAFHAERRAWLVVVCVLLYVVPQQLYVARLTEGCGLRASDIAQLSAAVTRAEQQLSVSDQNLDVYGDYRLWFAHPHFYHSAVGGNIADGVRADLLLCYDQPPQPTELEPWGLLYCSQLQKLFPLRLLDVQTIRGHPVYFYGKQPKLPDHANIEGER